MCMHFTWLDNLAITRPSTCADPATAIVPTDCLQPHEAVHHNSAGRPQVLLNLDQVELLRLAGFTWKEASHALMVSESTIRRRLREANCFFSNYC